MCNSGPRDDSNSLCGSVSEAKNVPVTIPAVFGLHRCLLCRLHRGAHRHQRSSYRSGLPSCSVAHRHSEIIRLQGWYPLSDRLARTKCFTQLDLTNAYHWIRIREEALPSWSKCRFRREKFCFLGYIVSSHVVLTFRCSPNFYRGSIQGFSKIAAPLTLMLRTSSSTDSSTSVTQIAVEYNGIDGGGDKSVKKSSESRRIVKSRKTSRA